MIIGVLDRVQMLEDTVQKLQENDDIMSDLGSHIKKFEDKLDSHKKLGVAAKEPKHMDKVKVSPCFIMKCSHLLE